MAKQNLVSTSSFRKKFVGHATMYGIRKFNKDPSKGLRLEAGCSLYHPAKGDSVVVNNKKKMMCCSYTFVPELNRFIKFGDPIPLVPF